MRLIALVLALCSHCVATGRCDDAVERGTVRFDLKDDQKNVPERYRLEPHSFAYEMKLQRTLPHSKIDVFDVTFPSPVVTDCPENNTVHCEYYRPQAKRPMPCVVVLDITGGNQQLSRTIATVLAQNGLGALFVQMAYYGPRRPPGSPLRLLSMDYPHSMAAVRQTVLDIRRAAAWIHRWQGQHIPILCCRSGDV